MTLAFLNEQSTTVGSYELHEKIAEGGMGTVYKGRHRETGDVVAIKIVPTHLLSNTVFLRRFEQEYNAARNLVHPNIVRALDYGRDGLAPYLVMEYVDGESVGQRLDRDGKIPEAEAVSITVQVARGLHKAHQMNLVHRDVKPDNILIAKTGEAKLTDMGLVKELEADLNLTRTGRGLGTPYFMAPEQFRNAKNADARCDIYSLAASLYMMVTGVLPFDANGPLEAWMKKVNNDLAPPRDILPTLSERVDWAIRRAMSAKPEQRPESMLEFIEDLMGQSLHRATQVDDGVETTPDTWYLATLFPGQETQVIRTTTGEIRRGLKDGRLQQSESLTASRSRDGTFEPLRQVPEFRDLVIPLEAPKSRTVPAAPVTPTVSHTPRLPGKSNPQIRTVSTDALPPLPNPSGPSFLLKTEASPPNQWAKWVIIFLLAVVGGLFAFAFMPLLIKNGWIRF